MSLSEYEWQSVVDAYNRGLISQEQYNKLLNDITTLLWDEM